MAGTGMVHDWHHPANSFMPPICHSPLIVLCFCYAKGEMPADAAAELDLKVKHYVDGQVGKEMDKVKAEVQERMEDWKKDSNSLIKTL